MEAWDRPLELPPLRPGASVAQVLTSLAELQNEIASVVSAGGGVPLAAMLDGYTRWVDRAEQVFRYCFEGGEPVAELHTARYWHVRSVGSLSDGTIRTEARAQSDRINAYHAQLSHETAVFSLADDELALVLDTNVYLHYHQLDLIDWSVPFPGKKVRIVLPMPVLDELDEKKYDRNEKVRSAASQSIRLLRSVRGAAPPETPVPFGRLDVPLQIMLDPPRHRRHPNTDDEIVGRAEHLKTVANGEVVVGTADHGMHTRATVAGLGAWWPPDNLKRARDVAAIEPSVLEDPSCK